MSQQKLNYNFMWSNPKLPFIKQSFFMTRSVYSRKASEQKLKEVHKWILFCSVSFNIIHKTKSSTDYKKVAS